MSFNPFRTLAGRLVLVTIVAIAISHLVAFSLFANERGRSIRRERETAAIERIVGVFDRLRALPPDEQAAMARASSDFATRFSIAGETEPNATLSEGARLARTISEQLTGVEVRARTRVVEVDWRARRRAFRQEGGFRGPPPPEGSGVFAPGAPPGGTAERVRGPGGPPDEELRPRDVTELTVDLALAPGRWLRARSYLPAPRPVPINIWFAALASMLAVGAGALLIARQIGKPLEQLANAAERLGHGETNVAAPVSGPEDVRRASTAFNAMAERLGRQMSRQRQMLWALSHDLRTPITAMRLRAEFIEDDAAKQRLLQPLSEMETLTEQALALARAGASEEARERVDLAEIAQTLCNELQELGIDVAAEAPQRVPAEVRPSEIARAMRNLAENAAKYGGGGVMKVYRDDKGTAVVEVVDEGPGLPPDQLARITEPFFRADAARSGSNGAGLGLSIAQAIADGHGGKLVIANRTPKGLSAKLVLPG